MSGPFQLLRRLFGDKVRDTSIREIDGEPRESGLTTWYDAYCTLQWAEIWSSLGAWIETVQPACGPRTAVNFQLARTLDRQQIGPASHRREDYCRRLDAFLGPHDLLCLPTTPALAPLKGTLGDNRANRSQGTYYPRTLSLTSIAGIGRLPQVTLPLGEAGGVPIGLSLLAGCGRDIFLLEMAARVMAAASA